MYGYTFQVSYEFLVCTLPLHSLFYTHIFITDNLYVNAPEYTAMSIYRKQTVKKDMGPL